MSEITTGRVNIPATIIAAPITAANMCVNLATVAVRSGIRQWQKMQQEVERAESRLRWAKSSDLASPKELAKTSKQLYNTVMQIPEFVKLTVALPEKDKIHLAASIVLEKNPARGYITEAMLNSANNSKQIMSMFDNAASSMATDKFKYVQNVVTDAAAYIGFATTEVLKSSDAVMDMTFTDQQGHKLTAYARKDNEGNTRLALDLHGFDCNSTQCSNVMQELVAYLHQHGVPFSYHRLKHNQPTGVLRRLQQNKQRDYLKKEALKSNKQSNKIQ